MKPDQISRATKTLERMMYVYNGAYDQNNHVDDAGTAFERGVIHGATWVLDWVFSENERFRVESELKAKYGLTLPHTGPDVLDR
jgi:hypothetical protein